MIHRNLGLIDHWNHDRRRYIHQRLRRRNFDLHRFRSFSRKQGNSQDVIHMLHKDDIQGLDHISRYIGQAPF
jgi:hypothetical protein